MAKRNLDDTDRRLISLLRANARMPTAALGRHLGLSRSAVQERLKRLERDGVITGYTIVLGETAEHPGVSAHVLVTLDPKFQDRAMAALKGLPEVSRCYTVRGGFDAGAQFEITHPLRPGQGSRRRGLDLRNLNNFFFNSDMSLSPGGVLRGWNSRNALTPARPDCRRTPRG